MLDSDDADNAPVPDEVERLDPYRPASRSLATSVSLAWLIFGASLLFWNLGAYGLWNDEADTVLFARGVWRTGDTTAIDGENVYLFRKGMLLRNLHNRATPPLAYYLLAPFVGLLGTSAWVARLPFALCGLMAIAVAIRWLWREHATSATWLLTAGAWLTSAPYFLFCRQSRYYAAAMLLSVVVVYCYGRFRGQRGVWLALLFGGLALLTTQYLNFAALLATLAVDYVLWQRREYCWSRKQLAWLLGPLLLAGGVFWLFWSSPIKDELIVNDNANWFADRWTLFWWHLRDLNRCEHVNGLLFFAAPILAVVTGDRWLLRIPLAIVAYAFAAALVSPQPTHLTNAADIRYLAPLIPLGIVLTARVLAALVYLASYWSAPIVALALGSNALHLAASLLLTPPNDFRGYVTEIGRSFRSTPFQFAAEIASPRPTASRLVADWVHEHVRPGQTVWIVPTEETYPLMAQAPRAVYAWQLDNLRPAKQFEGLSAIHFFSREPVDFIVVFGPQGGARFQEYLVQLAADQGWRYERVATLDVFWRDDIRPELHLHRFHAFDDFDRRSEAIEIYRRLPRFSQ